MVTNAGEHSELLSKAPTDSLEATLTTDILPENTGKTSHNSFYGQVLTLSTFPQAPSAISTSYHTMSTSTVNLEQLRSARLPENGSKSEDVVRIMSSPTWILSRPHISPDGWTGGFMAKEKDTILPNKSVKEIIW